MGGGFYNVPGFGVVHINFGSGKRAPLPCAHCRAMSTKRCDHQVAERGAGWKSTTCDAPICDDCALHVPGKNLDYCKHHAKLHAAEVPAALPLEGQA